MKKFFKWVGIVLGGLVGLVVLALAIVYIYVGQQFSETHDVAGEEVPIPTDEVGIVEGERLARIRGCMDGCHGSGTEGQVFFEVPDGTKVVAPDLARLAREYSVAELERLVRHGVKPDDTSVLMIMPSNMFYNLSDADLGAIVAFLRTREPGDKQLPKTSVGPIVRTMLLYFSSKLDFEIMSAASIDHDAPQLDPLSADPLIRGEYQARTVCTECHGDDLQGLPSENIPSLALTVAYSREDFGELMRTGTPIGSRELDLMKTVAENRFSYFTDAEIDDLHAYLQTLASAN